jgi:hypothetical protein
MGKGKRKRAEHSVRGRGRGQGCKYGVLEKVRCQSSSVSLLLPMGL